MPGVYVIDTHTLIWYLTQDERLSPRASRILREAELGEATALVPIVVLAEALYIAEKKRVPVEFGELLRRLRVAPGFLIVEFDLRVLEAMLELPSSLDLHDRVLAATASVYGAALVTKDEELHALGTVQTLW